MGLMVNGPGILGRTGTRGQAGHQHIKMLATKAVSGQGGGVGHRPKAHSGALQQLPAGVSGQGSPNARPGSDKAHHLMPPLQQRAHGGLPDGAGGADDEHPPG